MLQIIKALKLAKYLTQGLPKQLQEKYILKVVNTRTVTTFKKNIEGKMTYLK